LKQKSFILNWFGEFHFQEGRIPRFCGLGGAVGGVRVGGGVFGTIQQLK